MSKQTLETLENEYLAKRTMYLEGKNQIHEFQKKAKQRTEELTACVYHIYRDSNTIDVKSYLNEMMNNLEQMNDEYKRQLAILDESLDEEKKIYLKQVSVIEEEMKNTTDNPGEM